MILQYSEAMRAVRIHAFGGPQACVVDEIPTPRCGPGDVLIRVGSAALGHMDVDVREGHARLPMTLPMTMGFEAAGTIEALGSGVHDWRIGDRVLPYLRVTCQQCRMCRSGRESLCGARRFLGGAFAEQMVCPASHLMRLPDGIDLRDAAALPDAFGTAWHMLFTRGRLRISETVLINSVGSGIASAAVQLAVRAGARVIGTASRREKLDRAAAFGMHHGIIHTEEDVTEQVLRLTAGRGVDLVFEHVGGNLFRHGLAALAVGGRMVTCGGHAGETVGLDARSLTQGEKAVLGSFSSSRHEIERGLELVAAGELKPVIHARFPLEAVADAMACMERRDNFGKIVLVP